MKPGSKSVEAVRKWRKRTKQRIIDAMGGECQICSYRKSTRALALHHLDPSQKEMSFGAVRANPRSWAKIVAELRKCVLLCSNCHLELHDDECALPAVYSSFNEDFVEYRKPKGVDMDECPQCAGQKPVQNIYCSPRCVGKAGSKVDWDSIDLPELLKVHSNVKIAMMLHISEAAVRKRRKKLKI